MKKVRKHEIDEILNYLERLAIRPGLNKEPILENITFFKHVYSLFSFYKWLYTTVPKIKPENLLELMDIDSNSSYDTELIASLAALERKVFPGIVTPLVRRIFRLISDVNNTLIINLGSGAMEVERQIIAKLICSENKKPVIFIGIDKSTRAHAFAKQHLNEFKSEVEIIEKANLDDDSLNNIFSNQKCLYTVVLCNNDIFSLDKYFTKTRFDLAFNCFFKHHFTANTSENIDILLKKLSKKVIEYDGINNHFNSFIQPIVVWKNPVLLSGTVFSNLRFIKKTELRRNNTGMKIKTYWIKGTYLKEMSFLILKQTPNNQDDI
jgi:hypothetical protein